MIARLKYFGNLLCSVAKKETARTQNFKNSPV